MNKLEVRNLVVRYGRLTAVDGVSFAIPAGGTLGLVGESGSGKSTVARALVQLVPPAAGQILMGDEDVTRVRGKQLQSLRTRLQMVFQDPYSSLNPRMTVGDMIEEVLREHQHLTAQERRQEVLRLLDVVALESQFIDRYPHQFSGGQRQRIAIARALAVRPEVIILDEVVSSLDVSVQADILNLLRDLQREFDLTYLFISHDLSVVRYMSDAVSVMYLGRIVEWTTTEELFRDPEHPYTRGLIDSIPKMVAGGNADRLKLSGEIPDPRFPPSGCRFHTRCPIGPLTHSERHICLETDPHATVHATKHYVACHFPLERKRLKQ
jgi:oligopeptide/dipeptide ABC transporter ATP-binding protein